MSSRPRGRPRKLRRDELNQDELNPDLLNPDLLNPDLLNPDLLNKEAKALLREILALEALSKCSFIRGLANHISKIIICMSQGLTSGTLSYEDTAPVDRVVRIIRHGEKKMRRTIQRRSARQESRWRAEKALMEREIKKLGARVEGTVKRCREVLMLMRVRRESEKRMQSGEESDGSEN
ncbi:hypothetical protein BO71DRAFT_404133 [Aspergillus ellipticus CBS 707.79]|uniref:Uncharacterized protein n=1 Tax=Aspergillus ellipticus CBS 707.79 TaxID=1448320 RepID=A0A319DJ02_9EURO|nr:hypothetical protein BO71DRAFT_404133 [Aspergillus ellipticus CBS 707.79]